ncbi:MAG: heparinase II/III family protein [Acidobacteriota bacterium]|nr:heparinase II/III family protein [Acidobacteriota bacterium]
MKGRTADEIRVRGSQLLAANLERHGLSKSARVPTDKEFFRLLDRTRIEGRSLSARGLIEQFRNRTGPHFFAAFDDTEETLQELRRRWPQGAEVLVEKAERILEGKFDLLGWRDLDFGRPVDWHLEPVARRRAPLVHWSRIDYLNPEAVGDHKIIWELNRHQYFKTLGRAYWLTRDERYAQGFAAHIKDWMDRNPPKLGINWASSLEVAFRSISWLWALHLFRRSPALTPELFLRVLKFLYVHARHVETYLSTYFSPNTHLTGEALGLFYLGTVLPEFRAAARWRETGKNILTAQLDCHVKPDGVYFEQSTYYHRYTTDFYTHLLILMERSGDRVPDNLREKLTLLLDHLMYITRPDGTTPYFGDDDGGRLMMLDERETFDFRAALSTGAALFSRSDYKGLRSFDRLAAEEPAEASRAFAEGGYYVMRDGWARESNYLMIDCGPHGTLNCGHAHSDALSFELAARGRTLLVDPGTYTYTTSVELRDLFRSSAAHNTLTVDNESSSVPAGAFTWGETARCRLRAWVSRERFDFFEGEHDGYERLSDPVTHVRSIFFLKNDYWIMRDRAQAEGEHDYELHFHFSPQADSMKDWSDSEPREDQHRLAADGLQLFAFDGAWACRKGWVSSRYGERTDAPVYTFGAKARAGAQEFFTFLIPADRRESQIEVREMELTGARAFEIRVGGRRDFVVAGEGRLIEVGHVTSDFEWTWARSLAGSNEIEELILLNGRRLSLYGDEIINAGARVPFAHVKLRDGQWSVEIDGERLSLPKTVRDFVASSRQKSLV